MSALEVNMDKIFIHDLQIETIIGVLPHERTQKQPILINLEISTDIRPAAKSENVKDAIDYSAIAQRITEFVSQSKFQLLETLAEKIAEIVLTEFNVKQLRLQLSKPQAIANAKSAGVIIERKLCE